MTTKTEMFNQNTLELIEYNTTGSSKSLYTPQALALDTREIVHLLVYLAVIRNQSKQLPYSLALARPIKVHTSSFGAVGLINIELTFDPTNNTFEACHPEFFPGNQISDLVDVLETMLRSTNCVHLNNLSYKEIRGVFYSDETLEFSEQDLSVFKRRYEYDNDWVLETIRPLSSGNREKRLLLTTFTNKINGDQTYKIACATHPADGGSSIPTKLENLGDFGRTVYGGRRDLIHSGKSVNVCMAHVEW